MFLLAGANHDGGGAGTLFSATAPASSQIIRGQGKYKKVCTPLKALVET